jgi:hypothetical protein
MFNLKQNKKIKGGLDFTFCPMDLCILYETETKENTEWE